MSFLNRFLKKQDKENLKKRGDAHAEKPEKTLKLKDKKKANKPIKSVKLSPDSNTEVAKSTKESVKIGAKTKSKFKNESEKTLLKPLITEKVSDMAVLGKYAFKVSDDANKISVKKAVLAIYGVKVKDVRIINVRGKRVRYGRNWGITKSWKKAIVALAPGEKIDLYEGV